jgi:hypothetical protein
MESITLRGKIPYGHLNCVLYSLIVGDTSLHNWSDLQLNTSIRCSLCRLILSYMLCIGNSYRNTYTNIRISYAKYCNDLDFSLPMKVPEVLDSHKQLYKNILKMATALSAETSAIQRRTCKIPHPWVRTAAKDLARIMTDRNPKRRQTLLTDVFRAFIQFLQTNIDRVT